MQIRIPVHWIWISLERKDNCVLTRNALPPEESVQVCNNLIMAHEEQHSRWGTDAGSMHTHRDTHTFLNTAGEIQFQKYHLTNFN